MKKLFCFGNMKGGVGKSTITALTANLLSMEGKEVCVIDCDNTQNTLADLRARDSIKFNVNEEKDNLYYISNMASIDTAPILRSILMPEYDFVLVDLPGNIVQEGIIDCYLQQDIIFVLFNNTYDDISSTIKFYHILRNEYNYNGEIIGIPCKIDPKLKEWIYFKEKKSDDFIHYTDLPFKIFDTFIKHDQIAFSRNKTTINQNFKNAKGDILGLEFFEELKTYIY